LYIFRADGITLDDDLVASDGDIIKFGIAARGDCGVVAFHQSIILDTNVQSGERLGVVAMDGDVREAPRDPDILDLVAFLVEVVLLVVVKDAAEVSFPAIIETDFHGFGIVGLFDNLNKVVQIDGSDTVGFHNGDILGTRSRGKRGRGGWRFRASNGGLRLRDGYRGWCGGHGDGGRRDALPLRAEFFGVAGKQEVSTGVPPAL